MDSFILFLICFSPVAFIALCIIVAYEIRRCCTSHYEIHRWCTSHHVQRMVEMQPKIPQIALNVVPVQPTIPHSPEDQRPYSNSPTDAQKDHNRWVEGWNHVILTCN